MTTTTTQEDPMTTSTALTTADVSRGKTAIDYGALADQLVDHMRRTGRIGPIAEARAEVARLLQSEVDWSALRDQRAAELAKLEAVDGGEVLDAGSLDVVADAAVRMITIRAEIPTIDRTIDAARERRVVAIKLVFQHEAAALWAQAQAKRDEAAAHRVRTDELLAELEAHEGVPYEPVQPDRPNVAAIAAGHVGGAITIVSRRASRTEALLMEAAELERRAAAERSVTQHGRIETTSVEQLVAEATQNPMHIGPTIASIRAWAGASVARLEADIATGQARHGELEAVARGKGRPVRFEMFWTQGEIDVGSSRVFAVPQEPVEVVSRGGLRTTFDRTTR
jgi:hypothetical protein